MDQERIHSVSSLTAAVKGTLESGFPFVWVRGQVANLSRPSSGHVYFSLKDEHASLAAVWFKGNQRIGERFDPLTGEVFEDGPRECLAHSLENGQELICAGKLTVYGARGVYQMVVEIAQDVGVGHLHAEFERLKEKLGHQGYFSLERKRPLPLHPRRIAVVTAPTGAAIHDFLTIASTRGSGASIRIYPSKVQGTGAAKEIARQMDVIQKEGWAEVIVLIRGGGSLEDLWQFNEEVLAGAVKNSRVPVLAGVGHEVDFTLADMTADVRAATPSHAAQLLWPDRRELEERLARLARRLEESLAAEFNAREQRLDDVSRHLEARSPLRRLAAWDAELTAHTPRLGMAFDRLLRHDEGRLDELYRELRLFPARLDERRAALDAAVQRMGILQERWMTGLQRDLERSELTLESLNPLKPLERGYAMVYRENGALAKKVSDVVPGDLVAIMVTDGTIAARVETTGKKETP